MSRINRLTSHQKETPLSRLSRTLSVATLVALLGGPLGAVPAFAQASATAPATATISGTVLDPASHPVVGAMIALRGPSSATTTTDGQGHYTFTTVPGVYSITVTKAGLLPATEDDIALTSGNVSIITRMQRPTFSSLATIGSTRTTAGGASGAPTFNTTPASQQIIGQQVFENQGDLQVRDILDETPGIIASLSNGSANGGVPGAITFPNIRGGLSYETATLIDGHPLAVGGYGDYVSTFINRFLFQSVELEKGPGAVTPEIARAINGTVNFRTWDPTPTLTAETEFGVDGWGGKYGNMRIADTIADGKLGFVFDYAVYGTPGPAGNDDPQSFNLYGGSSDFSFTNSQGAPVSPSIATTQKPPGLINTYSSFSGGTIGCCIDVPTWYQNRGFLGKLRYNFSNSTSLTLTELSTQTFASQNGNNLGDYADYYNPPFATGLPSGIIESTNPYNDSFAGDWETNNEPMFEGELRTSLGNDNILFRAYNAAITRASDNGDPAGTTMTMPVQLYGETTTGQPLTGLDPYGKPYEMTITDPAFPTTDQDVLTGYSFEYDHLLGDSGNVITLSADQNYSESHYFEPGVPDNEFDLESIKDEIPSGSTADVGTYMLRGTFQLTPKLSAVAGYYLSRYSDNYATAYPITDGPIIWRFDFTDRTWWHQDDRLAFSYRADHNTSLRLSAGSGIVPPYLELLGGEAASGTPTYCGGSNAPRCPAGGIGYSNSIGGGLNIRPETSFGYDFGGDHRFGNGSTVLSGDIYLTNLHNQYLESSYVNGTYTGGEGTLPLYTEAYSNLSNSRYEGIELALTHTPQVGVGYVVQGSLMHDYPFDVPQAVLSESENYALVPGVNFGPDSLLSNTRMAYSQGYAELNYRNAGFYANVGALYFGSNNSFNEPAFAVLRSSVRVPLFRNTGNSDPRGNTWLQLSVNNIGNVHSEIFDLDYQGSVYPGNTGINYYATNLKGYGPRQFELSVGHNFR